MKLLIVDNNTYTREAVRELMASPGIVIEECTCGEEAVRRARTFKPDWVTMDLHMAGMNGLEAAALIRRENAAVQIVLLTYDDQPYVRQAAREAGVAYLTKEKFLTLRELLISGGFKADSARSPGETGVESP